MGQLEEALAAIENRNKPYAWRAGIYLADKLGHQKKVDVLGIKFIQHCLAENSVVTCYELTKKFSSLAVNSKFAYLIISVCFVCVNMMNEQHLDFFLNFQWFLPIIMVHEMLTCGAASLKTNPECTAVKADLKNSGANVLAALKSDELTMENEAVVKKINSTLHMSVPLDKSEVMHKKFHIEETMNNIILEDGIFDGWKYKYLILCRFYS